MADFNDILPSGVDIQAVELTSVQPTVTTASISGRMQVRSFGGHYWSMKITMPRMKEADLKNVYGFLVKQRGSFSTFTIAPSNLTTVHGTASIAEDITDTNAVGDTVLTTSGSNEFKVGDMVKFTSGTKAHMVVTCSGNQLTVEPGLLVQTTASHDIHSGSNFEMTVRLTGDNFSYKIGPDGLGDLEFNVVEAI